MWALGSVFLAARMLQYLAFIDCEGHIRIVIALRWSLGSPEENVLTDLEHTGAWVHVRSLMQTPGTMRLIIGHGIFQELEKIDIPKKCQPKYIQKTSIYNLMKGDPTTQGLVLSCLVFN